MSGQLFDDVKPIRLMTYRRLRSDIQSFILNAGASKVVEVGSTGLVKLMGDIDLAVEHPGGRDGLLADIGERFQTKKVGNDLVSIRYPVKRRGWVQLDVMVGQTNYLQWSRAGSTTPGIKNSCRAVLLNLVTRRYSELYLTSETDHIERHRYTLDFGVGLKLVEQTRRGEKSILKSWKTVKSTFVTDDPDLIVEKLFSGSSATGKSTRSLGGVVTALQRSNLYVDDAFKRCMLEQFYEELTLAAAKKPAAYGDMTLVKRIIQG